MNKHFLSVLLVSALSQLGAAASHAQGNAPWVGTTFSGVQCSGNSQGFGPFDYLSRSSLGDKLNIVESHHFTHEVEQLVRGKSGPIAGDIDYTLRAWPNHHRALNAMMRYQNAQSRKWEHAPGLAGVPPVECYFQRAINFSPKDGTVRMLFAMHLQKNQQLDRADIMYEEALDLEPRNIQLQYNFALLLIEKHEYERARKLAIDIYAAGFPLMGLQKKLRRQGFWP